MAKASTKKPDSKNSAPPPEPEPSASSYNRYTSQGSVAAAKAALDNNVSQGVIAEKVGQSRPLVNLVLSGRRLAGQRIREYFRDEFGVPFDSWDRPPTSTPHATTQRPSPVGHTQPATATVSAQPGDDEDPDPYEEAKKSLREVDRQLAGELSHSDRVKYIGQKTAIAKLIAQLTGELDQTDLQKFRRTIEYQDTVRRVIRAIQPYPEASAAVIRELGHAVEVAGKAVAASELGVAEIREYCGHAENFVTVDDLCPAIDGLVYPISDRERELVRADLELARRVLAVLEKTDSTIRSSKVSFAPANDYRARLIDRLRAEIARESMFADFERDFGCVACERARALG